MTMRAPARTLVRTPRRARQWAQRIANGTIIAATHAGQIAFNLLSEIETDLGYEQHNITISALNFNINYRLTASAIGDDTTVSAGVALVGEDAYGIGTTALPDPATDHADWMFWDTRTLTSTLASDGDEQVFNSQLEIRNRSMRKMRENHQRLVCIVRCTVLQPTSLQVFLAGRSLLLLP